MRAQRMDVPVRWGMFDLLYKVSTMLSVAAAAALPVSRGRICYGMSFGSQSLAFQESFACYSFVRHIVYYLDV